MFSNIFHLLIVFIVPLMVLDYYTIGHGVNIKHNKENGFFHITLPFQSVNSVLDHFLQYVRFTATKFILISKY